MNRAPETCDDDDDDEWDVPTKPDFFPPFGEHASQLAAEDEDELALLVSALDEAVWRETLP